MTFADIIDRTIRLLGENPTNPQFWTRDKIGRYVNDAYVDMARDTGALEIRAGVRAVANQGEYETPRSVSVIERVAYDDYELKPDTARRLDRNAPGWQTETGTPERWLKSRSSPRKFTIYKIPTATGAGATTGGNYGRIVEISGTGVDFDFSAEHGRIVSMVGPSVVYRASSEYGKIVRFTVSQNNIQVWGKETPVALGVETEVPELPSHTHLGIAFRAAEYALRQERDGRNEELAGVYEAIADEYEGYVRGLVSYRTPERDWAPSQGVYEPRAYNLYRNTEIPATGLPGVT